MLKTRYEHIHFEKSCLDMGLVWKCYNNKSEDLMATVSYYKHWKKCVIEFESGFVFDEGYLRDVVNFLEQLKGN